MVRRRLATLALLLTGDLSGVALTAVSAEEESMAFAQSALPDDELAQVRGKFVLPNGIEVAMTVRSDTLVDGNILLRSVLAIDAGKPVLSVFAPAVGQAGPAGQVVTPSPAGSAAAMNGVAVTIDRAGGIAMIRPTQGTVTPNVTVGGIAAGPQSVSNDGLVAVPVSAGGPAVDTGGGQVSLADLPNGQRVTLDSAQLAVHHLVGQAFGTIVANSGNDRNIDTMTTIDIDLQNATAAAASSSMFKADTIALDATRGLIR